MSYMDAVRGALRVKLAVASGLSTALIELEGRPFTKPAVGTSYVRETLKPFSAKRRSIGPKGRVRERALYLVDVFVAGEKGTRGEDALVDMIVEGFWPGLQLLSSGPTVTIVSSSRMGASQETDWRMVPVSISLYFDRINSQ